MSNVYAVDADHVLEHRGAFGRLPVQQHAVCFDARERDEGRNGDLEAKHLHQLFDGLREDLVGAKGDPACGQYVLRYAFYISLLLPEQGEHDAGGAQPAGRREQQRLHVVADDVRRPVQRRGRV